MERERLTTKKNPKAGAFGFMAEAEGFEPPWAFTPKLFSRQPRYDRFDMPPYMKLLSQKSSDIQFF